MIADRLRAIMIKSGYDLYACGYNNYGQLGLDDTTNRKVPTKVGTDTWVAVAGGEGHSLALKE